MFPFGFWSPACADRPGLSFHYPVRFTCDLSLSHNFRSYLGFEIDVSYRQDDGRLSKFVVGLFFKARRSRTMIARFDNEHGFIHLDLLDARGRLKAKVPFATFSLKDAIQHAKKYFEDNAVLLKEQFDRWS